MTSAASNTTAQEVFYPKQKSGAVLDKEESKLLRGVPDIAQPKGVTGSP